ncbi:hypothetical protein RB601_000602 [Gaeumannomyces tritici]
MRASEGQPVSAASNRMPNLGSIAAAAIDHGRRQSLAAAVAVAPGGSGGRAGSNANKLRPLLPNVSERVGKRAPSPLTQQLKKKRTTVQAACQSCRKRKVKCDGLRPVCAPCTSLGAVCEYSVPEGLSQRDAERQRMNQVSKSHRDLLTILDLLRRGPDAEAAEILRQVKTAATLEDAVARIADATLLLPGGSPEQSQGTASPESSTSTCPYDSCRLPHNRRLASPFDQPEHVFEVLYRTGLPGTLFSSLDLLASDVLPVSRWVPGFEDDYHLTYLLTLFWTWDNTFASVVDRVLFLEDMRLADPLDPVPNMDHTFCTPFLVLCLLTVSCLYSTHPKIYSVPGDHSSRGLKFARAAKRILEDERRRPSITMLQGITLLWLYEGSAGDARQAERYMWEMVDLYFQLGLHRRTEPDNCPGWNSRMGRELQAISYIVWGIFSFNAKIAVNFEYRFYIPRPRFKKLFDNPLSYLARSDSPTANWCAYPVDCRFQPSHHREVFVAHCTLAELAEELMDLIGRSRDQVPEIDKDTRLALEGVYNGLIRWRAELPDHLQPNNSTLPSVLSLHATYELIMIRLLGPLAAKFPKERFGGSTAGALKNSSSFSMINTVWTFRAHYTLKHEYWLTQVCAAAAMSVLFNLDDGCADVFVRACQALHETGEFVRMANKNLTVIQQLIDRYRIRLPQVGRTVETRYFVALRNRQSTAYSDGTRVLMYVPTQEGGGGCKVDNIQDEISVASARPVACFRPLALVTGRGAFAL